MATCACYIHIKGKHAGNKNIKIMLKTYISQH